MNTSSLSASSGDVEVLTALVIGHYEELKDGNPPREHGFRWRMIQRDRNAVYRVEGRGRWYIKIPRHADVRPVRRELQGAAMLAAGASRDYLLPILTRGGQSPPYLLTSEIQGRQLNLALYRACFLPVASLRRETLAAFSNLGHAVGRLHEQFPSSEMLPTDRALRKLPWLEFDADEQETLRRAEEARVPVHGNLGLRNVLTASSRVGIIDFENFGVGSAYDDLSAVASQLALTSAVDVLPKAFVRRALDAFVNSYRTHRPFDVDLLAACVGIRIRAFQARAARTAGIPRIAGIPVRLARVERLRRQLGAGPGPMLPLS